MRDDKGYTQKMDALQTGSIAYSVGVGVGRKEAYSLRMEGLEEQQKPLLMSKADAEHYDFSPQEKMTQMEGRVVLGDVVLKNCLMSCSQSKNIVQTAINGVEGTIKEWISGGDVVINLTIICGGDSNTYPKEEVAEVMRQLSKNEAMSISNEWLGDVWGVTRVVINSASIKGEIYRNVAEIEVAATSDESYEIEEYIID
jgi:3-isopropylmalate dehydratase large subunit